MRCLRERLQTLPLPHGGLPIGNSEVLLEQRFTRRFAKAWRFHGEVALWIQMDLMYAFMDSKPIHDHDCLSLIGICGKNWEDDDNNGVEWRIYGNHGAKKGTVLFQPGPKNRGCRHLESNGKAMRGSHVPFLSAHMCIMADFVTSSETGDLCF